MSEFYFEGLNIASPTLRDQMVGRYQSQVQSYNERLMYILNSIARAMEKGLYSTSFSEAEISWKEQTYLFEMLEVRGFTPYYGYGNCHSGRSFCVSWEDF